MNNKKYKVFSQFNKKDNAFSHFKKNYDLLKCKKAAEMTIGTIIVIILALIVLAVIVYGFTTGWSNLWQNIIHFGGGQANLGTVVTGCGVFCESKNLVNYCAKQQIIFNDPNGKLITAMANCDDIKKGIPVTDTKTSSLSAAIPASGLDCDLSCASATTPTIPPATTK